MVAELSDDPTRASRGPADAEARQKRGGLTFWVYVTYKDLVMAVLSWWWLICDI